MGGEIGERGSGTPSERFLVIFYGFEGILTVGAKEIIKNPPDPSSQTFEKPKNRPKRLPLEDAPFFTFYRTLSFFFHFSVFMSLRNSYGILQELYKDSLKDSSMDSIKDSSKDASKDSVKDSNSL